MPKSAQENIHPSLLKGLQIQVIIKSKLLTQIIIKSLEPYQVKIVDHCSDYIITDYSNSDLDYLISTNKDSKIINIKSVDLLYKEFNIKFNKESGKIVLCDSQGKKKPNYKYIEQIPQLIRAPIPIDQFLSPYYINYKRAKDANDTIQNVLDTLTSNLHDNFQEPKSGYCEICNMHFKENDEHRKSEEHRSNNTDNKWILFDHLSRSFNRLILKKEFEIQNSFLTFPPN